MAIRRQRQVAQKRVMGIDPSLTSTGFCFNDEEGIQVGSLRTKFRGMQRLEHQINQLRNLLNLARPEVVVYEDYALGVRGQGRWSSAELGGQFKLELYLRGIPVILVPPKSLKLAFAGSGNADKPRMKKAGIESFDLDSSLTDDEVDAYALHALGRALLYRSGPEAFVGRVHKTIEKYDFHPGKGMCGVHTVAQFLCVT